MDEGAVVGEYSLPVTLSYSTPEGVEGRSERAAGLALDPGSAVLVVTSPGPGGLVAWMTQGLDMAMANNGTGPAEKIVAFIIPTPGSPVKPTGGDIVIPELGLGGCAEIHAWHCHQ